MRFLALLVVAFGLALAQMNHDKMQMGGMEMKSMAALEKLSGKDFDIAYMSMMIGHHKGAVEMARQALAVSRDSRILRAAQDIRSVQNKEIAQLTARLKNWYGVAPSKLYMEMMRSDMRGMMTTAINGMQVHEGMVMPVDKSFLEGMIPHHQDAVNMSQSCLNKAAKAELKTFCQGVIAVQNKEIKQYQGWLKTLK